MGDATALAPASEWHAAAVEASTSQPQPWRRANPDATEGKEALNVLGKIRDFFRSSAKLSSNSAPNSDWLREHPLILFRIFEYFAISDLKTGDETV